MIIFRGNFVDSLYSSSQKCVRGVFIREIRYIIQDVLPISKTNPSK